MFFPDKARAFAETRRVLGRGGRFLFNVWDRIETNETPEAVIDALAHLFPTHPPDFLRRVPHGYHDIARIQRDLASAGFTFPHIETLAFTSHAPSARVAATAFCEGTPLRNEIEAHSGPTLKAVTNAVTAALEERFGPGRDRRPHPGPCRRGRGLSKSEKRPSFSLLPPGEGAEGG